MNEVQFATLLSMACAITNRWLFEGLSWAYLGVAAWKALS
jgi:hypothetical protein